jgi:hypothetical protein
VECGAAGGFGVWVSPVELIIAPGEVCRLVTQKAHNDLDALLEHGHPFLERREGDAEGTMLVFVPAGAHPQHQPSPLRVSTATAICARRDGCRNVIGDTSDPNRSRVVARRVSVNTTHVSSASRLLSTIDMKWSEHQSDSKPNSSPWP